MSKILITGSLGLVGSEAVSFFKEQGWEVIGIDNNMRSYFFGVNTQTPQYEIDIRDEKAVDRLFQEHKFDAIIHTAAQPSHDWAKKEPLTDFDINARGTLILLEATRKYCPDTVFVNISTDKVYGENMQRHDLQELETRFHHAVPFDENTGLDHTMRSVFGCSKTTGDIYTQEYGRYFGIKTVCFRPGCITGKNHKGAELHGFMAYLVKCIKEGITYNIFGYKGKQVRDQIHAYDLVTACYEFIKNPKIAEVYNIGGGEERSVSILEAIKLVEEETGKKCVYNYVDDNRKGDRIWDIHDVSKFQKDYPNWKFKYSLKDIIKDLCQKS
jgi:CDP-paratose 2-epimerase